MFWSLICIGLRMLFGWCLCFWIYYFMFLSSWFEVCGCRRRRVFTAFDRFFASCLLIVNVWLFFFCFVCLIRIKYLVLMVEWCYIVLWWLFVWFWCWCLCLFSRSFSALLCLVLKLFRLIVRCVNVVLKILCLVFCVLLFCRFWYCVCCLLKFWV